MEHEHVDVLSHLLPVHRPARRSRQEIARPFTGEVLPV